jgi:Xaa-Pro aminopeptidase
MFDLKKIDNLFPLMKDQNLDAVMIGPSNNLEYITGFNPEGCERFQALFITKENKYFYLCNLIYAENMKKYFPADTPFYVWSDSTTFHDLFKTAFEDFGLDTGRIGVGESIRAVDLIDMESLVSSKFINGISLLEELRIIKTESDLNKLRTAARMADNVLEDLAKFVKPGMTEKQIKDRIEYQFLEQGAQALSFNPIVACGNHSSMPHYCGDQGVIAPKDILLLDLGCRFEGYCSDISRTFFIGDITEDEKKIYSVAKEAQRLAISKAFEGNRCCDVDKAARDYIESQGLGDSFLNRTGHGIGFDVHEAPYMNGYNTRPLERGMAFSVEPGICITDKVGMRVEDIVVINHQGETEVLNKFTKEIVVIK